MTTMTCEKCGAECDRDEVHNGICMLYGPWGCSCGWSEDSRYDHSEGEPPAAKDWPNHVIDSRGGATPRSECAQLACS